MRLQQAIEAYEILSEIYNLESGEKSGQNTANSRKN